MPHTHLLKGLYALTDATLTPPQSILSQVERILKMGVSVVQFRDKYASDEAVELTCKALQALCKQHNALFILDDRLALAQKIDADGLHIGKDDVSYEEARAVLGKRKIIGVSCYGDIERAKKYEALGADYVAFGAFFPSLSKPQADVVSLEVLKMAKEQLHVPICAIGGITVHTLPLMKAYPVEMYAIISAVYQDDAIEANIKALQALM